MDFEGYIYHPGLGTFYNPKGKRIGSYTRKYGRLVYRGKEFKLARLAFFLMEGSWPPEEVDHIDGNTHNNSWVNLRKCSRSENARNKPKRVTNKTGFKGVYSQQYKDNTYYLSKIQVDKTPIYLGTFEIPELAAAAYDKAAKHFHGKFANTNFKG